MTREKLNKVVKGFFIAVGVGAIFALCTQADTEKIPCEVIAQDCDSALLEDLNTGNVYEIKIDKPLEKQYYVATYTVSAEAITNIQ